MFLAILSIIGGIVLVVLGFVLFAVGTDTHGTKGYVVSALGAFMFLTGIFIHFYCGWWGVIRAVIDYIKQ